MALSCVYYSTGTFTPASLSGTWRQSVRESTATMVARVVAASSVGKKARVVVLQPFLKRVNQRLPVPEQDQLRATATHGDARSKLEEAVALVDTLGCDVVFKEVVPLRSVHPKFLFGSGKTEEMSGAVSAVDADAVFVNAPLSGQQQKALSSKWGGAKVLDRFRVILDIFADRARTTEAKLQVELAGLKYEAAHLVKGANSGYDRQRGGFGAMGGSGEKAIETQRRQLRDRTAEVNRQLREVERRRGYQRSARNRRLEPTVALVGYTNVGKSSLLNQLALGRHSTRPRDTGGGGGNRENLDARSGKKGGGGGRRGEVGGGGGAWDTGKGMVHAKDRVFDTLDPAARSVSLPSRTRCVLVDTVGFIQDLPTDLVLSFKSTLEEVKNADVLLHVRDASVGSRVYEAQRKAVEETLEELGAGDVPTLEVWNKVDKERDSSGASSSSGDGAVVRDDDGDEGEEKRGTGRGHGREPRGDMTLPEENSGEGAIGGGDVGSFAVGNFGGKKHEEEQALLRQEHPAAPKTGPDDRDALRVSAATGEGLALLLERVDAMLHLRSGGGADGSSRFSPKPVDRFQYVRVLPGQSHQGYK